ncbi:toll/interleukin-1 receptor domain-containing protein [Actinophytocola sp.]|uniref:toll/interleukin-1 receptor domain-containing protein n=1 Tax=Actinophytocola sp. TaxID=1872138 RepID=UPI003899D2C4
MRPRVFLSYSAQDAGDIADRVEQSLTRRGAAVYRFQNPQHSGARFIRQIPREIEAADYFVALMSPAAETSETCQEEREVAVHVRQFQDRDFIYVFKVGEVTPSGWLRTQEWIDLTPPVDDARLETALDALPLTPMPPPEATPQNRFRNRDDELRHIGEALTTSGDNDFWVVLSGPKLGKSWFLRKVKDRFETSTGGGTSLVDLRTLEIDVRYSAVRLLCLLLDVEEPSGELSDVEMNRIVGAVAKRNKPQLSLLDSAELMDPETATELRLLIDGVHRRVGETPFGDTRLSVVVGTRREDEWLGYRVKDTTVRPFRTVSLTEFGTSVVRKALVDTGLTFDSTKLTVWTDALHHMTAGLPALIVGALDWAAEFGYASVEASASDDTFDSVVKPYIEKDLLSIATLIPEGGEKLSRQHKAILAAFRVIAPYRIITKSHIKYHLERDEQFEADLAESGWSNHRDLWRAIEKSALTKPGKSPWLSQYPAIRQLLYRYFYRQNTDRRATHDNALVFYKQWGGGNPAGMEQGHILVECVWHAAMTLCCDDRADIGTSLPDLASELAARLIRPAMYEPSEWRDYVRTLLSDDKELLRLTEPYDGLFDKVLCRVCDTIGGGD